MDQTPIAGEALDLGKLSQWAPELARTFVALSSDIALVIDHDGVIRNVEQGQAEPISTLAHAWIGRSWIDTVSVETRSKVEKLLREASGEGIARRREVNHPLHSGASVPVAYTAIRLGEHGPVLAVGRDMRAIAAIQERFIETQQDMERGYWSARQAESRYRLLFQVATDAVMVIDPDTQLIVDANPAAATLFASVGEPLIGKNATVGFAHASRAAVTELLAAARSSGVGSEIRARLLGSVAMTSVAATSFRASDAMRLLVRVRAADESSASANVEAAVPTANDDATVVTDSSGRLLLTNPAFLRLVRASTEDELKGTMLVDWLGPVQRPVDSLIARVRDQGVVGSFAAVVRPAAGAGAAVDATDAVDVSGMLLTEGDQERIGFTLRRRLSPAASASGLPPTLSADLARLVERVGELSLARLVSEAAALAEAHFIERALATSRGDAAAAAVLLGVEHERIVRASHDASRSLSIDTGASDTR